uniref:E3 ubiquitin-protein ligase n=1 Tax=Plectus sambesii TaxID=2011161 RepID=A0A914X7B7_9BILA
MKRKRKAVQARLKAILEQPLPRNETAQLRTRYPTFEMAQQYGKSTDSAIDVVNNDLGDNFKVKKLKKLLNGRLLRRIEFSGVLFWKLQYQSKAEPRMDSGGKANRSVVQNLFGGHRVRRSSIKESKAVQGPKMDVLMAMVEAADWAGLEAAVYEHWSHTCPQVFMPNAEKPWEINIDEQLVESVLLGPLTALYMADESEKSMKNLAQKIGFKVDERRPGQICGYMFKSGEPTYTCKECANDPTCVLCYKCFVQSPHRQHKYRMHTSGGSGYCDCGDDEAWKRHPSCELHRPLNEDERMETGEHSSFEMPAVVEKRLRALTVILLRYATRVICWQTADELPDGLTRAAGTEVPYQTILFNDETHTYDAVIRALELAIHCTEQQAMLLATIVDREGRSSVRAGSKDICDKAKTEIQRKTAKDTNPRTEKKGPLEVKTMDSSLVAHQQFAIRVLTWLISSAQDFPPLAKIIGDVLLNEKSERHAEDVDGDTLIVTLMRFDRQLWKAARQNVHQMLMTTVLMDLDQKKEFSRKFLQLYTTMFNDFIDDDHDHNVSVVALTVQMFTVPTIARMLIAEESAMKNILGSLVDYCKQYEGAKGRYDFTRKGYPVVLKRALYMVHDLRYLLTSPPSKDEWTPLLRSRFLEGCQMLFTFLSRMQGMDDVRRQAGEHQVYESEWETAFNIQLRIQNIITLVLSWAATDAEVHRALLTTCFSLIKEEAAHYDFNKIDSVEVSGHETSCISFDVSRQRLSAHMPIWRLAAGLFASAPEGSTFSFVSSLVDSLEKVGCPGPAALMEMPLRVNVLCAQSQASMWRRNGFSLINQIHNYFSPLCRTEMYDKDILMLQVGAALTEPNDFVIRVLNRYGLDKWAEATYEETRSPSTDELSKLTVSLAEELLHLFIILVGERWTPGVGQTTREDLLRREVLHILCTGPKPFSKIEHHIPDDPLIEKLSLDEVVRAIGDFRKPAGTTAGTFQLKASFREEYNPFFYHYSKSDLSQAEQHQQKERKDLE